MNQAYISLVILITWRALLLGGGVSRCFLPEQRIITSRAQYSSTTVQAGVHSPVRGKGGGALTGVVRNFCQMFLLQLFRDFVFSVENIQ